MEIQYIWLSEYANFKNQGINLSSKYIFDLQLKNQNFRNIIGTLYIKHNPNYIPDLFGKKNLKNVTAIIGKNGSGKSNILDFIKNNFPEGLSAGASSIIVAYSQYDNFGDEFCTIVKPKEWTIEIEDKTNKFKVKDYDNSLKNVEKNFRFSSDTSYADYIYYSFFLDYKNEFVDYAGLINLSTTALLSEDRRKAYNDAVTRKAHKHVDVFETDLNYLIKNETLKAIEFLSSYFAKKVKLPFKKPTDLDIYINITDRDFFIEQQKQNSDVSELIISLDNLNNKTNEIEKFINNFYITVLINLLLTERKYAQRAKYNHDFRIRKNETIRQFVTRFFTTIKSVTIDIDDYKDLPNDTYERLSEDATDFFKLFEHYIEEKILTIKNTNRNNSKSLYLKLNLSENSEIHFQQFIDKYLRVKQMSHFLNFRWRNLSTGEQSFLSFMSRFYHLKYHELGKDLKGSLIILIDEGDAGFHPQWQKTFFKTSMDFLSTLFEDKNIQLIYTANAPFITSDLTNPHVLFLDKKKGKPIILSKENNHKNTFASNIHTLFSDAFYMENGALMGQFAEEKINKIIKFLNSKSKVKPNENYRNIIHQIGEPILKLKLLEMWSQKFGNDEKIKWHKEQIEKLERDDKNIKNNR